MSAPRNDIPVLVASDGPLDGQNWTLNESLLIGRDAECHIVINDRQVSRKHAKFLVKDNEKIVIEDAGSKNGTFVNGNRISSPIRLKEGDEIKIAAVQAFYYISSDATIPLEDNPHAIDTNIDSHPVHINMKSRKVLIHKQEMIPPLSDAQFRLLELLYQREGQVVTRNDLIEAVWGADEAIGVTEQAVDALVRRLRNRIRKEDPTLDPIKTIRGVGFIFENLV